MRATKHRVPTAVAVLVLTAALSVVGCGASSLRSQETTPADTPTDTATVAETETSSEPEQSASAAAQPTQTTSTSTCVQEDHSYAPGGYCLYPGKVTWLDSDVLPVDPATLDWSDPDAVARAFVITANTWDSRFDHSGSYAWRRAQIFEDRGRTNPNPSDPDTARGQVEHVTTWRLDSYTSVEIHSIVTEGMPVDDMPPDPLQPDGTWRRIVTYTRTVHTRADGGTPYIKSGVWFLTLAIDPASGQWLIVDLKTTLETDLSPTTPAAR